MSMLESACPNCMAPISRRKGESTATCEYCGSTFVFHDDEKENKEPAKATPVRQPSFVGADAAGSLFTIPKDPKVLLLWIAGWMLCPLIPISVLVWRSNITPIVRNTICGAIWALFIMSFIVAILD